MRVTSKGQVTIPQGIRKKLGIAAADEVDFIEEGERVFLVKSQVDKDIQRKFRKLRGVGTVNMTTEEIMALTRGDR